MNYAEILVGALGPPHDATPVSPDDLATLASVVPAPMLDLWREHGWAGYGGGLFWTLDPRHVADLLPEWELAPPASVAVGRDAFANVFLLSEGEVYQLDVHTGEPMLVGSSLDMLFAACLAKESYRKSYMRSDLFDAARARCGSLAPDECYGFFPAPALGGSLDVASVRRVKYYEHLQLLAQLQE